MNRPTSIADILELSVEDRIDLVGAIWDSIAECPEAVTLTEPQQLELEARYEAYKANPDAGSPWETIRARIVDKG